MQCEPATSIINIIGGTTKIAALCSISVTQAQRWKYPRAKGGTDGFIPRKYHQTIAAAAAEKGVALAPAAFIDPTALPPKVAA
jgi:hypothetical protein